MREGNKLRKIYPNSGNFFGALPIVMGKATTYLALAMMILLIILGIVMPLFGIPVRSSMLTTMVFMIPFILSIVFMGLCLLNFLRRREDAIMLIMYTSLPSVMLTGFSWPSVAMPQWLNIFSYIVPTTLGAKGFYFHHPNGRLTTYHYALLAGNVGALFSVFSISRVLYQKNHK